MLLFQLCKYLVSRVKGGQREFNSAFDIPKLDLPQTNCNSTTRLSIIIPTRDKVDLLRSSIDALRQTIDLSLIELVIVDNGSVENETHSYLEKLKEQNVRILNFPGKFNFSAICNFAARESTGDFLCFLNNDAQVLTSNTLSSLMGRAAEPESGVVGPVIMETPSIIQEFGLAFGFRGIAGSLYSKAQIQEDGISGVFASDHQVSAISFSCAVIKRQTFESLGGLDEDFAVGLNDVDFCYRAKKAGLKNFVVSSALVLHKGYGTRSKMSTLRGGLRAIQEILLFLTKHPEFSFKDSSVFKPKI